MEICAVPSAKQLAALMFVVVACTERKTAPAPVAVPAPNAALHTPAAMRKPAAPPKRLFARKYVARIREAPTVDAKQRGYLRSGTVLTAKSAEPVSHERCLRGWYEIAETGGFVCDGREVTAFAGLTLPDRQPTAANRDAALPYRYAYNRGEATPMYKRLPSENEALFWEDGVLPADASVPESAAANDAGAAIPRGPTKLADLQGERGALVRRKLRRGFHVSLDREFETATRRYWRSMSNGYIPHARMVPVTGSSFHGVSLVREGEPRLPLAFVVHPELDVLRENQRGRPVAVGKLEAREFFSIKTEKSIHNRSYLRLPDGRLVRQDQITRIERAPRPDGIESTERWIDVNLTTQALVAYEGDEPVYATLVSTGRVRNERNPAVNHETPAGRFRILSKHVSATMDGDHAVFGAYSLEDVPYVQFFRGAFALHGAFWHDKFGRPASHGCINLAPLDALWLFDWTRPEVPAPWHAAYPDPTGSGTWLVIRGKTPRG